MSDSEKAAGTEPSLGNSIDDLLEKTRLLLEWMPTCSVGSSGHSRRIAVEAAMQKLEEAWAYVRL